MSSVTESGTGAAADLIARKGSASQQPGVTEIPYTRLGFRIFGAILVLAALMTIIVGVFAVITYPTAADAHAVWAPP